VHIAQAVIPGSIEGGSAKAVWGGYRLTDIGEFGVPGEDPKFYFTVHSAWCGYKESGKLAVELRRPELSDAQWADGEGKETGNGLAGEVLKLGVRCNGDMEEGAGVTFRVYEDGMDPERDEAVEEIGAENRGGKAEGEWTYHYRHDAENPLTEKPKYYFTANGQRCKEVRSGNVEMGMDYFLLIKIENEIIIDKDCEVKLSDGTTEYAKTDKNGILELKGRVPGTILLVEIKGFNGEKQVFIPNKQDMAGKL
jgi:hypothetical protein